ncbi:transaldolase [Nitrosomonas mobilis]|uniref:Transaldolase n=1 Tax=Nitrosomonas mobilis TaxID=51642 RepID=A0A1G5SF42_9PROT|nr:transaldolase [Nitrosomonas mobilis]SCZ85825.1 Transaldolase [Nitrosomonas mobilis]HNO74163.1 transaldolase [Nitrosomonas mobilis]
MNPTQQLHALGQSLWLDNITRELLTSGTLARYIKEFTVTGLTSNPSIFDHAIRNSDFYDAGIRKKAAAGKSGEALFFELALEDLTQAADLLRPVHDATNGIDGWVSLEVSPLLAHDTAGTIQAAEQLYAQAQRPNLFIKIPGNAAGIAAIEASIFAGIPVNVTLLFSREHYVAAAEAYLRGIERRLAAGLDPKVTSVASLFISRWDVSVQGKVPETLRNRLGIAIGMRTYKAYCELLATPRWRQLADAGATPQRLLWASTGTKDPGAPDTLYLEALAAPNTINTIPEKTLLAFADHGAVKHALPLDGGNAETLLAEFMQAGVNPTALAAQLQQEGEQSFAKSWNSLMACITSKCTALT